MTMPVEMTRVSQAGQTRHSWAVSAPRHPPVRLLWGREERGDIVFPYFHEGLRSGDKCLWAFEATDHDAPDLLK